MKADKSQRAAHEALGIWCQRCAELADVVAIYQHSDRPLGRLEQIPLCAGHGRKAIEHDLPRPRLVEHEAALARQAKADRERRRGGQPPKLKLKAASATGPAADG